MSKEAIEPKVFISYSWSNQEHQDWVRDLAEKLMANGVNTVLDIWDFKEGQDKYDFMESMVKDEKINKVLVICDKAYSTKADDRAGGVGTETQIISSELYEQVKQTKFIPIVVEVDSEGKPYLPVFLKARKYINLSNTANSDDFEVLLRAIFDKPLHKKPPLGKKPSFLEEESVKIITSGKYHLLRDAIEKDKPILKGLLSDFIDDACELIKSEYIESFKTNEYDEEVLASITRVTPFKDQFCNIIDLLCKYNKVEYVEEFFRFFEELMPYMEFYGDSGRYMKCQFDNIRFVLRESFITMLAILIKNKEFKTVNAFITRPYLLKSPRNSTKNVTFSEINKSITSLDDIRKKRLNLEKFSVANDLLTERATYKGIGVNQICEVDFILWFNAICNNRDYWWPGSMVYLGRWDPELENFVRAESKDFFEKFKVVLNVKSKSELEEKFKKIKENEDLSKWRYQRSWDPFPLEHCLNLEKLDSI